VILSHLAWVQRTQEEKDKNKPSPSVFIAALRLHGIDMDVDQYECIFANLIVEGYAKGYIAHNNRLVLKTVGAFPRVSTINANNSVRFRVRL
jgi:nuclear mRNA export protein PCID2/THP1